MTQATPTTARPPNPSPPDGPSAAAVLALGGATLLALAAAHRTRQQRLALLATQRFRTLWRFVDPRDPQGSWALVNNRAVGLMAAVQAEAARGAGDYVAAALAMQGHTPDLDGLVAAGAFGGIAADGRALDTLLSYPAFEAAAFVDQGMAADQAAAIGQRHLERIVATETADAARVSTGVAVVNDRRTRGYIRMLTPPSCSRCVILAGRWYRWNAGFERHPQCDCVHIPAAEDVAGDVATSVKDYFGGLSEAEQNRTFTKAGAQAVRDGADMARVVNARRKGALYTAGGRKYTREATTRRGTGRRARLTPEQIYVEANGNRGEALRLLRLHGYIL